MGKTGRFAFSDGHYLCPRGPNRGHTASLGSPQPLGRGKAKGRTRERLELADILRDYTPAFLERYGDTVSTEQSRVLHDLVCCRTAVLGGHLEDCDQCGHQRLAYNSCRNRHCPKCQAAARAQWLDERATELLPVPYFHVVLTLPAVLGLVALQNQRLVYGLLF